MNARLIDIITQDVCKLFELDGDTIFNLKVDAGISYLERRFAQEPEIGEALKLHSNFWAWWRELWAQRDVKLLKACRKTHLGLVFTYKLHKDSTIESVRTVMQKDVWEFYQKYHKPESIPFYPNDLLINSCMASPQPSPKEREIIQ